MSETYIKKGTQFWNDDHTEGYEITEDLERYTAVMASQFKALGSAEEVKPNHQIPRWLAYIILRPGGVDEYMKRHS